MGDKPLILRYNMKVIYINFSLRYGGKHMRFLTPLSTLLLVANNISSTTLIVVELVLAALLLLLVFLFRQRLAKIICACGTEICLWLACDMAFPNSLLTTIMTWITAFATIVIMISVVNHIDWSNLRGKRR